MTEADHTAKPYGTAYAKKAEFTLAAGDQVWHGATVKKPATARQTVG